MVSGSVGDRTGAARADTRAPGPAHVARDHGVGSRAVHAGLMERLRDCGRRGEPRVERVTQTVQSARPRAISESVERKGPSMRRP